MPKETRAKHIQRHARNIVPWIPGIMMENTVHRTKIPVKTRRRSRDRRASSAWLKTRKKELCERREPICEKPHPLLRKGWATPGCTRRSPTDALRHTEGTTRRATGPSGKKLEVRSWKLEARGEKRGRQKTHVRPMMRANMGHPGRRTKADPSPPFAKCATGFPPSRTLRRAGGMTTWISRKLENRTGALLG
jgi:hypothetical protein